MKKLFTIFLIFIIQVHIVSADSLNEIKRISVGNKDAKINCLNCGVLIFCNDKHSKLGQAKHKLKCDPNHLKMHSFVLELLEKNMAKHPKFKETLVRDGIDLQNLWPDYVHDGRPRAIEFG